LRSVPGVDPVTTAAFLAAIDEAQRFRHAHQLEAYLGLVPRSGSTHENALYVTELLAGISGRKVLLTSDYHMFRARRAFKKAGLEVLPRPFPDARKRASGWTGRWPAFLDLVGETMKIGYYYVRGWM